MLAGYFFVREVLWVPFMHPGIIFEGQAIQIIRKITMGQIVPRHLPNPIAVLAQDNGSRTILEM